jgi:hypothetical protein
LTLVPLGRLELSMPAWNTKKCLQCFL